MRRAPLRLLASVGTGHTPSRSNPKYWVEEERTIPWLTLADVWQLRDGTKSVVRDTAEKITPTGVANSSAVVHPAGTVALSRTASVGYSCILGRDMATSQDFVTWTCGPHLDNRFLLWVLRGERDDILGRMRGSTHKTIYMSDIEQLTAPVPDVDDQRRIAAYLDAETEHLDALISAKLSMIDLLEERAISLAAETIAGVDLAPRERITYAKWLPAIPNDWGWAPVSAHFDVALGRMLNSSRAREGTMRPYVRNVNVRWDHVDVSDLAVMDFPPEEQAHYRLRAGDLLINEGGAGVGRSAIWEGQVDECYFQKSVLRLRPIDDCNPRWLVECMRVAVGQKAILVEGNLSTIPHLPAELIRSLRFPFPPRRVQDVQLDLLNHRRDRDNELRSSLKRQVSLLRERRRSLITAAVTGEMEVA